MIGIIFDVDGVLLDSMSLWNKAGNLYLSSKNIQSTNNLGKILLSMSMKEGAIYLKENYGLEQSVDKICQEINELIIDYYKNSVLLKPRVLETLKYLNNNNILMVVATSSDKHIVKAAFKRLEIESYFKEIFTCSELNTSKNKPDIFNVASNYLKEISDNQIDIIVVEDSFLAAKTAKKAGFKVIGIYDESSKDDYNKLKMIVDVCSKKMKIELFKGVGK